MVRTSESSRDSTLDVATQQLIDLYPHVWQLTADRREQARHVLLTSSGDTVAITKEYDQQLPADILTLEPGQILVEISAADQEPGLRILRISGETHWRIDEIAKATSPEHVIPLDDGRVLVLDPMGEGDGGSQVRPDVDKWDGIDAA